MVDHQDEAVMLSFRLLADQADVALSANHLIERFRRELVPGQVRASPSSRTFGWGEPAPEGRHIRGDVSPVSLYAALFGAENNRRPSPHTGSPHVLERPATFLTFGGHSYLAALALPVALHLESRCAFASTRSTTHRWRLPGFTPIEFVTALDASQRRPRVARIRLSPESQTALTSTLVTAHRRTVS
jgi:hypothetical protein